jgi:hypothetical protein
MFAELRREMIQGPSLLAVGAHYGHFADMDSRWWCCHTGFASSVRALHMPVKPTGAVTTRACPLHGLDGMDFLV